MGYSVTADQLKRLQRNLAGKDADVPERKPRAPRGSREEPRPDLRLEGELVAGYAHGKVHRWKCMGYTHIAGCGLQMFRPGWKPEPSEQEKCPRCWGGED